MGTPLTAAAPNVIEVQSRARPRNLPVRWAAFCSAWPGRACGFAPPAGGGIACTVTAEDDSLIGRPNADLSAAKRIDLCFCDESGVERFRMADIPFDSTSGSVAFQQSITYAKAAA